MPLYFFVTGTSIYSHNKYKDIHKVLPSEWTLQGFQSSWIMEETTELTQWKKVKKIYLCSTQLKPSKLHKTHLLIKYGSNYFREKLSGCPEYYELGPEKL